LRGSCAHARAKRNTPSPPHPPKQQTNKQTKQTQQLPHFAPPPQPWREGAWKLQDGLAVGRELHETLTDMLNLINRAVDTLPDLSAAGAAGAAAQRPAKRRLRR
jgi:hypothetical protein